jgi:hypothetical protein
METNNFKKFGLYEQLFCFIISIVIFFLFKNISFLYNLLGEVNIAGALGDAKPLVCNDYYFCRTPLILYLYYYIFHLFSVDLVIFLQIFILLSATYLIRIRLINLNLRPWIANSVFTIIAINPKILKYSFSVQEEAFYIPALLLGVSSLIAFILKKNLKNLIYLNLAFALLVLIREAGIVFYFLTIPINIYYLFKIYNENYKKKILFTTIIVVIIIFPQIISKNFINYLYPEKINNHYFSMHALTSFISKQESFKNDSTNDLSNLIKNRITKLNKIREIKGLDKNKKLNFECIIFPAMNNLSYLHPEILNFYKSNYQDDLNRKLFILYVKNFFKDPNIFLKKFHLCFMGHFLYVELLNEEEMGDMKEILRDPIFDKDDVRIIESFHKISKNYYKIINSLRIINMIILVFTIISIIISIKSLIQNKNDKFALLSILFFCMYYLTINLHVNLISVQARWFFTYFPLLIVSNLKILELINLFFTKKNISNPN